MLCLIFVTTIIVDLIFSIELELLEMDDKSNITLIKGFNQRAAINFYKTCEMFDEKEEYSMKFERSPEDDVFSWALFEKDAYVLSYTIDTKKFFNGKAALTYVQSNPRAVGAVEGCKNCNMVSLMFENMTKWTSYENPVSFTAKIEHTICPKTHWGSFKTCFDNLIVLVQCAVSEKAITLTHTDELVRKKRIRRMTHGFMQ